MVSDFSQGVVGNVGKMDEIGEVTDYFYVNYLTDFDRGDMSPTPAPTPPEIEVNCSI